MKAVLDQAVVHAVKEGDGTRIAVGILASHAAAALLYLRGGDFATDAQERAVQDVDRAKSKAHISADIEAKRLLRGNPHKETHNSLWDAFTTAILANVNLALTARACGVVGGEDTPALARELAEQIVQAIEVEGRTP